jgi:integrase
MASFQKRTNGDGSKTVLAWVRIKPFKPASKAFTNQAAAKVWATELEIELRKQRKSGDVRKDLTALTLAGLITEYLADPETTSLRTYDDVERLLAWWVNRFGAEKILAFGTIKLREARKLLEHGRENGTVNRYLGALRSCWSWGRAAGIVPSEKLWPTRLFLSEPKERVRFLNDDELKAVMEAAETHAPWMYAAVMVSLATGVRQGELLRLEWPDVDFEKKTVIVMLGKDTRGRGTKRRIVHLPTPAIDALKKLRRDGIVGPKLVFVRPNGESADKSFLTFHWNAVRTAAGLVDFRWHDLRHSCASFLAQNGASLVEIGSVLGHSSPSVTAKYAHMVAGRPVTGADKLAEKLLGGT